MPLNVRSEIVNHLAEKLAARARLTRFDSPIRTGSSPTDPG